MTLHLVTWAGCACTDVQPTHTFPAQCPCHHGRILGTTTVPDDATTGHSCTLAKWGGS